MEMYEQITHIMELYGLTFDETFTYFILVMVGSVTGFGFFLSTCFDLGRCLYRIVKELFLLYSFPSSDARTAWNRNTTTPSWPAGCGV